jgi:pilus assembly protein CpaB
MKRPVMFVALAGLAAMLASVVVYNALKKREAEVERAMAKTIYIVVAATDLPLGSKIDPGQLKLARWSADAIPDGAFTNPGQVAGSFVKNQFVTNEPIVATKLFLGQKTAGVMPLLIPPGMRAVSVPVDEVSDISGFILPHTHVDVLLAVSNQGGGAGADKPFSKIVLQNVEVLAVAQEVENKKDEPEQVKVVTVLVTPQDAERLALATREGVLHLAMRNYSDNKIVLTSGSDVHDLLRQYSLGSAPVMPVQHAQTTTYRPQASMQVQIYRDGKSSESVSFVREALAETGRHHSAAASGDGFSAVEDSHSSDESGVSGPISGKDESGVSHAANSQGPTLPPSETVPEDQSASFAPKGKTIEIP